MSESIQTMLYGLFAGETFVVLDEQWARQLDAELGRLAAVTSWDEALAVARSMTLAWPPFDPDDPDLDPEEWGIEKGEPITVHDLPGIGDGEYPKLAPRYTADWLPEDLAEGTDELNVRLGSDLNEGYLWIDPTEEDQLVRALEVRGYATVRDDELLNRISYMTL